MDIIYEDNHIIVCRKPAGIAVQTAHIGQPDMVSEMKKYLLSDSAGKGMSVNRQQPYVGVVHRLDQSVEGVLLFAKNKNAAASLSRQIAEGKMTKIYHAVVCGRDFAKARQLTDYLLKDGRENVSKVVPEGTRGAKRAELSYEILQEKELSLQDGESGWLALAEIHLGTGRHHQIRVQLANAGMCLLGDYKYADEKARQISKELQIKEIALCACQLSFRHPQSGKKMDFQVEPSGKSFEIFRQACG